jgi:aerobic carbon-monoxide dehydrogenase medium subunit
VYDFNYHKPASLDAALETFEGSDDGQFMAGGQTMIPVMKQRLAMPSDVIDLGAIETLNGICVDSGVVSVGAMTPHAAVAVSDAVRGAIPALAELAGRIGDPHVRNRGTIGGSIANSDPAADYPAAVLGLNATVRTNRREIIADDFFINLFETALDEGELITAVDFPVADAAAYEKFENPASRFALAGVMVCRTGATVRVAVTGAGPCAFRATEMEHALAADFRPGALEGISIDPDGLNTDIHASAEYRAHLVGVLAGRAVKRVA